MSVRRSVRLALGVLFGTVVLAGGVVPLVSLPTASASPYPVTPANDPRDAANCTQHGVDGAGNVTWCRHRGVMATPVTGVGPRWAGNYAVRVGDEVDYVWCLDDSGSHPQVAYRPGEMVEAAALIDRLYGGAAHPEHLDVVPVAMGLVGDAEFAGTLQVPGFADRFDGPTLAAAVWAIQHYVVGDRADSGRLVVESPHLWSTDAVLNLATDQLWAYAVNATGFRLSITHTDAGATGDVDVTITETVGTPAVGIAAQITEAAIDAASNLQWRSSGAVVTPTYVTSAADSPDVVVGDGVVTLRLRLIDRTRDGTLGASRQWTDATSWMAFPAEGGQQSTGVYFAPNNVVHRGAVTVTARPPVPAAVRGRKVDDRGVALGGVSLRLDCGAAAAETMTDADGSWSFTGIPVGPTGVTCSLTETAAPAGTTGPAAPRSIDLRPGDDLDVSGAPIVNAWDRQFTSIAGSSVALPGATVTELAYARNLSVGEAVTVAGTAIWLADGATVPAEAPAVGDVDLGTWTMTGAGTAEVVAGQEWTLPSDRVCGAWQVVLTFAAADGTPLGAEGWGNPAQQVAVPCVRTTVRKITIAGEAIVDTGTTGGIPTAGPGETVTSTVALPLRRHRGDCADATTVATAMLTLAGNGPFESGVVATGETGSAYTFAEALTVTKERASTPAGWTTPLPGAVGATVTDSVTTVPLPCNPDETTFVPGATTQIHPTVIAAGTIVTDDLQPSGVPTGSPERPASIGADGTITWGDWRFEIVATGALHRWPLGSAPDCSGTPLTTFRTTVTSNALLPGLGGYTATAADEGHAIGWLDQLTSTVTNSVTGEVVTTTIPLAACGEVTETGAFERLPVAPAAIQALPIPTGLTRVLPRTGGGEILWPLSAACAALGCGGLCVLLPGSRGRRRT